MGPTLRVEPIRAIEELVVTRSAAHQCDLSDTRPVHPGKARDARGRAPQSPGWRRLRRRQCGVESLTSPACLASPQAASHRDRDAHR